MLSRTISTLVVRTLVMLAYDILFAGCSSSEANQNVEIGLGRPSPSRPAYAITTVSSFASLCITDLDCNAECEPSHDIENE